MDGMILYHGEPNGPSLIVLATLFETGLDVELRPIDLLKGERHTIPGLAERLALDMGVEGEGPVLVVDGEAMTESVFIAQYLDEVAGAGLQPVDPHDHWQMLMLCRRITERIAPAAAYLGCMANAQAPLAALDAAGFDQVIASIASPDLRERWQDLRDGAFPDALVTDCREKIAMGLGQAEDRLADGRAWLMGEFSIVDLVSFGWQAGTRDLLPQVFERHPLSEALFSRISARPSVQRALALATVPDPRTSWAPGPEINRWG